MSRRPRGYKTKLTETEQKIYDYLYEQLSVHNIISISRTTLAKGFGISEMTARRATDFITMNNLKPFGLKQIYSAQILNYMVYALDELPDVEYIDDLSIHMILKMPYMGPERLTSPFQMFDNELEF